MQPACDPGVIWVNVAADVPLMGKTSVTQDRESGGCIQQETGMNGLIVLLIVGAMIGGACMHVFGINAVLVRIYNDRRDAPRRR